MVLPALVWGGIWAAGLIGARLAARQIIRQVARAAARQAASRAAISAYNAAVTAGTLAPEDFTDLDGEYANANEKADALAKAMAAACSADPRKCEACEANAGTPVPRNWNMSERARAYQQFITGFPRNVEYAYNGVDFDGFWQPICTLVEAKDNYDFMLKVEVDEGGWLSGPSIESVEWHRFVRDQNPPANIKLREEAQRQKNAAVPSPPVELQWHCSQIALTMILAEELRGIPITPIYTPHPEQLDRFAKYVTG